MKEIRLSKWQTEVWKADSRYKVINIGRRGGKTTLAAVKGVDFAANNENSIIWYIAPTYLQAKSIMWEMLREMIPREWIKKTNETELKIVLENGSQILLKGAQQPDNLRGVRIDLAIFDEVAFFDYWEAVWKVMRPTMVDSKAEAWFISTPNGFNHFKQLAQSDDPDYQYFHYTSYDNPFLDRAEIEKMKLEMDEDSFAQEVLGEFRRMSGLIYKDFSRERHMVDVPEGIESWTLFEALDFGYEHMTAYGQFAVNPTGTEIYLFDGFYEKHFTPTDIAEAIRIKRSGRRFHNSWADSAQAAYIEELQRAGIAFTPVEKPADSVKAGISKVAELLQIRADTGKPTLMINKNLNWVAEEAERYRWIENKSDGYVKDMPLKRNDDAMDMIRYFAYSYRQLDDHSDFNPMAEADELFGEGGMY